MIPPRDDDQVEYKPGRTIRRDVGIRLGLITPEVRIGGARPAALAPAVDLQPEPVNPPPLQPSHEDLVSVAPKLADVARSLLDDDALARRAKDQSAANVVGHGLPTAPARRTKPRPAKRSLTDVLADADRGHRALRRKVKL